MTWRCVPVACWHKAPHIAAAAFGVLVAAHPMPAGRVACRCHMVWYPDAVAPLTTPAPRDTLAPPPAAHFDRVAPIPVVAPVPPVASAPWQDIPTPLAPDIAPASQPPTPVPEPASWAILAVGVAMLLRVRGRRNHVQERRS